MPKVGGSLDFQKVHEIRNVLLHKLSGAPSSPGLGQIYFDTSTEPGKAYVCVDTSPETWVEITNVAGGALDFGEAADISASDFGDTAAAGATGEVADAGHRHPREANPVTGHLAAGDPHTQYQKESEKSQANGYASLGGDGKVPIAELPDTVIGAVDYKGTWNANTNTPNLGALTPDKGDYYVVSVAGATSLGGITDWKIGDWAIYNGTAWEKVDNTDLVASVFGRTGAVVALVGDYSAFYVREFSDTIGDGSTTTHTVTHGLGTEDVVVAVRYAAGGKEAVIADWEIEDDDTITVRWEPAAATDELRVTVLGRATV